MEQANKVYLLSIEFRTQKYYVIDLNGSLSRNISDSMLFFDERRAESYAGTIESHIESIIGEPATVRIMRRPLSSVIPNTLLECISCP